MTSSGAQKQEMKMMAHLFLRVFVFYDNGILWDAVSFSEWKFVDLKVQFSARRSAKY